MDIRNRIEKALAFAPDRLSKQVANAVFHPYFVKQGGFAYKNESFNDNGEKCVQYVFADIANGRQHELFDHRHLAQLLSSELRKSVAPDKIAISPERVTAWGGFVFAAEGSRFLYDGKALARLSGAMPRGAVLSPDKTRYVYEELGNLFLAKVGSEQRFRLTLDGTEEKGYGIPFQGSSGYIRDYIAGQPHATPVIWSPDGKHFLTYRLDIENVEEYYLLHSAPGKELARPLLYSYKYALPGDEHVPLAAFYICNIETGELTPLDIPPTHMSFSAPIGQRVSMLGWSLEGNLAACYAVNRDFTAAQVYIVDRASGESRLLFTEESETFLFFDSFRSLNSSSPDTEDFAARTLVISEKLGKLFWLSERAGDFAVYAYDLDSGECDRLTDSGCVRQLLHLDDERNLLYFSASNKEPGVNPYRRYIYVCDLDSGEIKLLSREKGDHNAFFPPEGGYFLCSISAYDEPQTTKAFDMEGEPLGTICHCDAGRLEEMGMTYPIPFCEKGADGHTDIYGVMFLPNGFDGSKKYPVAEYYYGGNQTVRQPVTFSDTLDTGGFSHCFSAAGFITVIVDGRGTPHRGKAFHDHCYNNMGACAGIDDHEAVLKALCARYPFMDADRIGVWGHSGGGFAALHCMTDKPGLYKVAVSTGGNHQQELYSAEWSERYMGAFDFALWGQQNAGNALENLQGKLLLIHGELDDNVHPASTMRIVKRLIELDKDFDMLIMPDLHHTLRESDYYRRRVLEYFARNL